MPRKPDMQKCWYEAQRLANAHPDNSGGEWIEWERFPYDHESGDGMVRITARRAALAAAKDCIKKLGDAVRAVHVEQIYIEGYDDAQDC